MEHKTARLTVLIDPNKKAAFERLCAQRDLTASQVVRQLIRNYLAEHGVTYQSGGPGDADAAGAAPAVARDGKSASAGKRKPIAAGRTAPARGGRRA